MPVNDFDCHIFYFPHAGAFAVSHSASKIYSRHTLTGQGDDNMEITITQRGKVTVIALVGAIDALDVDQVRTALDTQVRDGKMRLVADVSQVEYINSAGLRAMVQTLKDTTRRGGDFRLANVGARIHKALDITGLTSLFKVYPDVDAAVASFAA